MNEAETRAELITPLLTGAFVPLFFGAFWKKATTQGALAATFRGIGSWLLIEVLSSAKPASSRRN